MSREPLQNIAMVCPEHAPKAGGFTNVPPEKFVGIYVKKAFSCLNGMIEHMWVHIDEIHPHDPDIMIGTLNQDPVYSELQDGATCEVRVEEIEDVFRG